ncbi:conserved hypothetical protein [Clostridium botulinum C str. Eklund]|nr:conserved hypothetical protein [Clostridium botulinum C str. Eklund]
MVNSRVNLIKRQLNEIEELKNKRGSVEFTKWVRLTKSIISNIFGENSSQLKEFSNIKYNLVIFSAYTPEESFNRAYVKGLEVAQALLGAFIEELNLFDTKEDQCVCDLDKTINNKIFIVHGRDNLAKTEVARFLEKLRLVPIVLNEQANEGTTIIEKLEMNSDVGFAIVLYTPCDIGGLNDNTNNLMYRARQNVVFEHGYLIGKIGRKNISALVKGDIETPNDISGIVYTSMEGEGWKIQLAKDLKAAGYNIDFNLIY